MTDYPRFQNRPKFFEESYAGMHGGGLVAIVLSWADRWHSRGDTARIRERPGLRQKCPMLPSH